MERAASFVQAMLHNARDGNTTQWTVGLVFFLLRPAIHHQVHHFASCRRAVAKCTPHCGCYAQAARFANATNRHACVRGFDDDGHAPDVEFFDQQVGHLLGHPFLYLRSTRNDFDQARQLAEPNDATAGKVADVGLAHKRQQVMLTEAAKTNVPNDNDLVVCLGKELF